MADKPTKRRKKNDHNSDVSDSLLDIALLLPESTLFRKLLEYERSLEHFVSKYRLSVRDALKVDTFKTQKRILRLTISHTSSNQQPFYHVGPSDRAALAQPPSWTLQVQGSVLERNPLGDGYVYSRDAQKMSKYFKNITVAIGDQGDLIEWNPQTQSGVDGFEVKRCGNEDVLVRLFCQLETSPPIFRLSEKMKTFTKVDSETRSRVLLAIYSHVKQKNLQNPNNRKIVVCDSALKNTLGCDQFEFSELLQLISPHLLPLDPVELEYQVTLGENAQQGSQTFDIETDFECASDDNLLSVVDEIERSINLLGDEIAFQLEKMDKHREERQLLLKFYENPMSELSRLIREQGKDQKVSYFFFLFCSSDFLVIFLFLVLLFSSARFHFIFFFFSCFYEYSYFFFHIHRDQLKWEILNRHTILNTFTSRVLQKLWAVTLIRANNYKEEKQFKI